VRTVRLLTVRELSGALHLHPQTVYTWKQQGRLPFVSIAGRVRFDPEEVERFIEDRKTRPGPLPPPPKIDFPLSKYDKLYLKGGKSALNKNARRWNYGFGSIYLRKTRKGTERWCIDYHDAQGQRRRAVVKAAQNRGEALVALQGKVAEIFSGKFHQNREGRSMSFNRLADVYLEDYAKVNKKSWKTDLGHIRKSMRPIFGEMALAMISPLDIQKYIKRRLEEGVAKTTVNRGLQILKRMFNLAIDWGYAADNPVRKVRMFSEKDSLKERILTPEEESRLLDVCPDHLKPIVIMALHTGMRRGEVLALRWSAVDFDGRTIKVVKSKSGAQRLVYINDVLLGWLRRQWASGPASEFVFSNFRTRQPFVEVGKAFRRACRVAGIQGLRFHDLRHSFASRLIEAGVDIITVKELLGHSSVKITERYTHTRGELKRRAVEKLSPKIPEFLARFWHAAEKDEAGKSVSCFFSMN